MREKIAPREFWNRRSQHYDEQSGAAYADAYRKTAECIRPYLTPNDRVLDFACGTGLVTLPSRTPRCAPLTFRTRWCGI